MTKHTIHAHWFVFWCIGFVKINRQSHRGRRSVFAANRTAKWSHKATEKFFADALDRAVKRGGN